MSYLFIVLFNLVISANAAPSLCPSGVKSLSKCYAVRGEFGQDGNSGSIRIWVKDGSILDVRHIRDEKPDIASSLKIRTDKRLVGVFKVCPTKPKAKGQRPEVCVQDYSLTPPAQ